MANLPESTTYDAGVYQLELTDPVQGGPTGVSNAPLKNLANRTAWLKSQIDGIKDGAVGLALYARLSSPTFTGSPAAPTAALGDNTTKLATTAFVQETLGGFLSKSIAGTGSVTLTAVEAGNGIIVLTGALTGNRNVIVPSSPTRPWIIRNATTGAFSVTVKTAAGAGVVVAQGQNAAVFCDGTNVLAGESWAAPLASPALTGTPTAPTPGRFDISARVANTDFIRQRGLEVNGQKVISANYTLTADDSGKRISVNAAGLSINLPPVDALLSGSCFVICSLVGQITIHANGSDLIEGHGPSVVLKKYDILALGSDGGNVWWRIGDFSSKGFDLIAPSVLDGSGNGYQKLPSGLIIQWGLVTPPGNSVGAFFNLPIAFPNFPFSAFACHDGGGAPNAYASATSITNTAFYLNTPYQDAIPFRYIAIGF